MSARRWRPWSPRAASQAQDAAELVEVEYDPLPSVSEIEDALKPGAPQVWKGAARQQGGLQPLRRCRQGRRRLQAGGPHRVARHRAPAADRERHGAARRDGRVGGRSPDRPYRQPESPGHARHAVRRRPQDAQGQGARGGARHRRRLRHEGRHPARRSGRGVGGQGAEASREVARRAQRGIRRRDGRPRPAPQVRAGARQGRQDPGAAHGSLRQCRRLSVGRGRRHPAVRRPQGHDRHL